jgi:rubredoxin
VNPCKTRFFNNLKFVKVATLNRDVATRLIIPARWVMNKYRCTVCGYIYDPVVGDSTQEIKPGTFFESLPDSWVCPECGVGKDMFEKV